jgi:putative membrane protein
VIRGLLKIGVNALAIWVAVRFVDGLRYDLEGEGYVQLVVLALLLAVVNRLVKPVAKLLSLPAIVVTLGLFLFVVNIAMFALLVELSDAFDLGLTNTGGFEAIAIGGLIVTVVVWVGELVLGD